MADQKILSIVNCNTEEDMNALVAQAVKETNNHGIYLSSQRRAPIDCVCPECDPGLYPENIFSLMCGD